MQNTIITFDYEVTTRNKGSPFDLQNSAVCLGWKVNNEPPICDFILAEDREIDGLAVGFNLKFDLHWHRRNGFKLPEKIWDCQVAEFLLSGQTTPYPSLESTAQKYNLGHKLDIIKLEYWDKGIQTTEIPKDVLASYCKQDVDLTYAIYLKQRDQFADRPALYKLFKLMMLDLLVLEEMEWNGLKYDKELCKQKSIEIETKLSAIKEQLAAIYPDVPINFNSTDHLSAFLYGGIVKEEKKVHDGFYGPKAAKAGQPKYKNVLIEHQLPRIVEPLKNSNLKKEGLYATDEATLRKLKGPAAKKYVGPLLELAKLEKLQSTYYAGLLAKAEESGWEEGYVHGQFNQVVAATGRLSSSKPNLQNFSGECLDLFISRYSENLA